MEQRARALLFRELHIPGAPIVLFNIWDAGSAKAVADAGAGALATGSWSVAAAQGYDDGEQIPLDLLLTVVQRITASVELPLSVDFEGAYADDPAGIKENIAKLVAAGAIGVNFEDQRVRGDGLYPVKAQCARILALRRGSEASDVPLFINARTDLFLQAPEPEHRELIPEAIERIRAYSNSGADGVFVPGLTEPSLIGAICEASPRPVNVMMTSASPDLETMNELGVGRISYGPGPYRSAVKHLASSFGQIRELITRERSDAVYRLQSLIANQPIYFSIPVEVQICECLLELSVEEVREHQPALSGIVSSLLTSNQGNWMVPEPALIDAMTRLRAWASAGLEKPERGRGERVFEDVVANYWHKTFKKNA